MPAAGCQVLLGEMLLRETSLGETSLGERLFGEMTLGETTLGETSFGKWTSHPFLPIFTYYVHIEFDFSLPGFHRYLKMR
jgi:hypothetical protein